MAKGALVGNMLAGRFKLVELIGSGGMAEVYLAEHEILGRRYAIKLLHNVFASDEIIAERFRREARATSRLDHPGIVTISDFGRTGEGQLYLVMEYIPGDSLRTALKTAVPSRLPLARSLDILTQLTRAVGAAHDAGVVHRDLKPGNILLGEGRGGALLVKVLDFGLAKFMASAELTAITQKGQVFGTPAYMSPEQGRGDIVDHRTDIYSIGVLAYELCTGRLPFPYTNLARLLIAHQQEAPKAPSEVLPPEAASLPKELERIIMRCLSKDKESRPIRADEVLRVFEGHREAKRDAQPRMVPQVVIVPPNAVDRDLDWCELTLEADTDVTTLNRDHSADDPEASARVAKREQDREWYWSQALKKARELAHQLRDRRLGTIEITKLLGDLGDLEERTTSLGTEIALAESRLRELDAMIREAETRLRGAMVDLSMERGRLLDENALPQLIADLDFQLSSLDQRLAEVYKERDARQDALANALKLRHERLAVFRQKQSNVEVTLVNLLRRLKPDPCPTDFEQSYTKLETLLRRMQRSEG